METNAPLSLCAQSDGSPPPGCQMRLKSQQLRGLCNITTILGSDREQQEKLEQILNVLSQDFNLQRGTIMLLDPTGATLRVEASHDSGIDASITYQRGEGITGQVLENGYPAIIPDIDDEPDFHDRLHRRRDRDTTAGISFICVPIKIDVHTIGTLAIDRPPNSLLSAADAENILIIVAAMIAHHLHLRRKAQAAKDRLEQENIRLRQALGERFQPENMIGSCSSMRSVYQKISHVAHANTTVLIRGESGTGKELVASAIHYASARKDKPFVRVNCAALNENLLESELFGHEKGAFTGATRARSGRLEEAEGGTLFLDEVGEFTPGIQVKLLRVLQELEYERVGSNKTRKANVRIITATNRVLEEEVKLGRFRHDLFYRINVFPIMLPPLRERRDDLLALANHFIGKYAPRIDKRIDRISTSAINMLVSYHWPGNVRELENCMEYAILMAREGVINGRDLPPTLQMPGTESDSPPGSLPHLVDQLERDLITDALKRNGSVSTQAARELGITPRILRYKAKKLGVDV